MESYTVLMTEEKALCMDTKLHPKYILNDKIKGTKPCEQIATICVKGRECISHSFAHKIQNISGRIKNTLVSPTGLGIGIGQIRK